MYAVGRFISRGVYTVSGPFHPFGGAVDIIVVEQPDGSFKSSPWYVKFGKFQGVLKTREKIVNISVNDVESDLYMYLNHKGEAYFQREVDDEEAESVLYHVSSGEDTDEQSSDRRPMKSHSYNFDSSNSSSVGEVDLSKGKFLARTGSRRAQILGYVFGRRSVKENNIQEDEVSAEIARASSLERAEIAADLLEVNWSTSLAVNKPKKDKVSQFSAADVFNDDADSNSQIDGKESSTSSPLHDGDDNNLEHHVLNDDKEMVDSSDPFLPEMRCDFEGIGAQMSSTGIPVPIEDMECSSVNNCVEEHFDVISVYTNDTQLRNAMNKENKKDTVYKISSSKSRVSASIELGSGPSKHFNDECNFDGNYVSSSRDEVLGKESQRDWSISCSEKLESSRSMLDICGEQTRKNMYLSHGERGEVPGDSETPHAVTEQVSEMNRLQQFSVTVSEESSNSKGYPREDCNVTMFVNEVSSNGNNVVNESLSAIGIHLITSSSNDSEVSEILHQDVTTMGQQGDQSMQIEEVEVSNLFSQQTKLSGSCLREDDDVKPKGTSLLEEYFTQTVNTDPMLGLVEDAGLDNICTKSIFNNSVPQIHDSKNTEAEKRMREVISFQERGVSPPGILEEEQFLISDLDNFKLTEVQHAISTTQCHVEKENILLSAATDSLKVLDESFGANYESSSSSDKFNEANISNDVIEFVEQSRQMSTAIDIRGSHEVVGESDGRLVESLPNLWSHIDNLEAHELHHPCHSLDSNTPSSKWFPHRSITDVHEETQLVNRPLTAKDVEISGQPNNETGTPKLGDPSEVIESSGSWWPFSRKSSGSMKGIKPASNGTRSSDANFSLETTTEGRGDKTELNPKVTTNKKKIKVLAPTSEQLASLNLKDGRNIVTFTFSTAMLGEQQIDARIYLWKWNTRIVISDVDGTITKSDVLGQFMPMVGVDWSHIGVAHLFSAIKENGYDLLFLSARAISQAYHTRQFLFNLKQNGKALPDGPVVISPDGLFPSLFREVIRRAPHEFKISCLEDIRALFPPDCNPFYAGFGNRDTDEISYLKVGIPKGKIFIINPKGEVAVQRRVDTKSYSSLHVLVNGMFPPMSTTEQEDFNSWNFWRLPPPIIDI